MFQIITQESMEPVAERAGRVGEWSEDTEHRIHAIHKLKQKDNSKQIQEINIEKKTQWKKAVAVTNLFHVAAEVHTCHSVSVTLEMSL